MSVYIQSSDGSKYYMDAVFSITYSQSGNPTEYAMEDGSNESDHYTQQQDVITLTGTVSSVKFAASGTLVTDLSVFEKELTALKKSGKFFTVSFSDNLNPKQNCLFTSLVMDRSTQTGEYSLDVNMSIKEIVVGNSAGVVATPKPLSSYADIVEDNKSSSSTTVGATAPQEKKLYEISQELAPGLAPIYSPLVK